MIRQVVTSAEEWITVKVPANMVGKRLEISCVELDEIEQRPETKPRADMSQFIGCLSKETGDAMLAEIAKSKNEWERKF